MKPSTQEANVKKMSFTLTNDYAFKKVFGDPDNKDALTDLLSVILNIKKTRIENVHIENPFLQNEFYDSKKGILDLKLELVSGDKINIEMQNYWHNAYVERNLFYWAKRYIEDFDESDPYRKLKPCINISILNSRFPYTNKIHSIYQLLEKENHTLLTNVQELHFLDLTKIGNSQFTPLDKWLLFIKTSDKEVREMLAKENPAMQYANQTATKFYTSKEERRFYEAAERYRHDRASLLDDGYQEGRADGLSEGKKYIASKLKKDGLPISKIIEYTGLEAEEIIHL